MYICARTDSPTRTHLTKLDAGDTLKHQAIQGCRIMFEKVDATCTFVDCTQGSFWGGGMSMQNEVLLLENFDEKQRMDGAIVNLHSISL